LGPDEKRDGKAWSQTRGHTKVGVCVGLIGTSFSTTASSSGIAGFPFWSPGSCEYTSTAPFESFQRNFFLLSAPVAPERLVLLAPEARTRARLCLRLHRHLSVPSPPSRPMSLLPSPRLSCGHRSAAIRRAIARTVPGQMTLCQQQPVYRAVSPSARRS